MDFLKLFQAAAFVQPRVLLSGRQTKGQAVVEGNDKAPVSIVVGDGVTDRDVPFFDGVQHAKTWSQFTGCAGTDQEPAIC